MMDRFIVADRRWLMLALVFVARIVIGFQFQTVGSMAQFIADDLSINNTQIGTLVGCYEFPGLVFAIVGGTLTHRIGDKATCTIGLSLMMLGGLLQGLAPGFTWALVGRVTSGAGAIVYDLALSKMITDWFSGREIVFAMSVFLASWPLGIAIGLLIQTPLAITVGWRAVMIGAAAFCLLSALIILAGYLAPARKLESQVTLEAADTSGRHDRMRPATIYAVIIGGIIRANLNLGLILFLSFGPALLTSQGYAPSVVGLIASLAPWVLMISLPVGGYLVERAGKEGPAIAIFSLLSGVVLLLLPTGFMPLILCVAFGITVGPPAGPMMSLPSRLLTATQRATGLGIFYTAYYLIATLGPSLGGYLTDVFGPSAALFLAAGVFFAILPLQLLLGLFQERGHAPA